MDKRYWASIVMVLGLVSGCSANEQVETPQQDEEMEMKMRQFLNDSSPRNSDPVPKLNPEFVEPISHPGACPPAPGPSEEEAIQENF